MAIGQNKNINGIKIERVSADTVYVYFGKAVAVVEKMDWHKPGFVQVRASDNGVSRYYRAYEGCSIAEAMKSARIAVGA